MVSKVSTPYLTTYDLMKFLALLLMFVDHVGFYFYPENDWLRAIGRACVPIWFFLIGFARSRDLSPQIWIGAGLLIVSSFVFGGSILPLNILVTILVTRLVLDTLAKISFPNWEMLIYSTFALTVLFVPSMLLFEYGTHGMMFALCGYIIRNRGQLGGHTAQISFMVYTVIFFAIAELLIFGMQPAEGELMVVGIGLTSLLCYYFKPRELLDVQNSVPGPIVAILQFGGRYTLEIYVAHLILFKFIACTLGLVGYGFLNWEWLR